MVTRYSLKEIKSMMSRKEYANGRVIRCELEVDTDKPARLVYTVESPTRLVAGEVLETEVREVVSIL